MRLPVKCNATRNSPRNVAPRAASIRARRERRTEPGGRDEEASASRAYGNAVTREWSGARGVCGTPTVHARTSHCSFPAGVRYSTTRIYNAMSLLPREQRTRARNIALHTYELARPFQHTYRGKRTNHTSSYRTELG